MKPSFLFVVASMLGAACLDPITSDERLYSAHILAPGSGVPYLDDEGALAEQIRGSDGVTENPVSRRSGFAAGNVVSYWDYGAATRYAITEYHLFHCDEVGLPLPSPDGDVDHLPILDQVPGDVGYSQLFRISRICVTDGYTGQIFPSRQAVEDGIYLGLLTEPEATTTVVNAPVLAPDVLLTVGPDVTVGPEHLAFYRGLIVRRFVHSAPVTLPGTSTVLRTGRVYRLRKTGDNAYAETVFSTPRTMGAGPHPSYTPIWRVVNVTMNAMFVPGSATSESALFTVMGTTLTPVHPNLTSFVLTEQYVHLELQYQEGTP